MSKTSTCVSRVALWVGSTPDSEWKNVIFKFNSKIVPKNLIVHLKRFTHLGTKLKTPISFPMEFSFDSDYLLEETAIKEQDHQYKLYAIIVHQGYSAHKGHYYSFIKS